MTTKLPAFQFYPGDWMKDPALRGCSIAARGLWMDMLCLMHESPRRGFLQHVTGDPVTAAQLARMTGCATDEINGLLSELKSVGVFSCAERGVIYSRRMQRDEQKRVLCSDAGKRGGGNPTFKGNHKGEDKGSRKGESKGEANPSSSTSSSSSLGGVPPKPPNKRPSSSPKFEAFWQEWPAHERKSGRGRCEAAWRAAGLDAIAGEVMQGLARWKASQSWAEKKGQFIPLPLTWLHDSRWETRPNPAASSADDAADLENYEMPEHLKTVLEEVGRD